jgi:hypothetical protein
VASQFQSGNSGPQGSRRTIGRLSDPCVLPLVLQHGSNGRLGTAPMLHSVPSFRSRSLEGTPGSRLQTAGCTGRCRCPSRIWCRPSCPGGSTVPSDNPQGRRWCLPQGRGSLQGTRGTQPRRCAADSTLVRTLLPRQRLLRHWCRAAPLCRSESWSLRDSSSRRSILHLSIHHHLLSTTRQRGRPGNRAEIELLAMD